MKKEIKVTLTGDSWNDDDGHEWKCIPSLVDDDQVLLSPRSDSYEVMDGHDGSTWHSQNSVETLDEQLRTAQDAEEEYDAIVSALIDLLGPAVLIAARRDDLQLHRMLTTVEQARF